MAKQESHYVANYNSFGDWSLEKFEAHTSRNAVAKFGKPRIDVRKNPRKQEAQSRFITDQEAIDWAKELASYYAKTEG